MMPALYWRMSGLINEAKTEVGLFWFLETGGCFLKIVLLAGAGTIMKKQIKLSFRFNKEKLDDFFDIYLILSVAICITTICFFFYFYS